MNPAAVCPFTVEHPVMLHRWERLAFLHWSYPLDTVQRLLPPGLTVEPARDRAWVGLVPFYMRVGVPGSGTPVRGTVPWATRFCETNVRTYVRDDDGRSGIWFFSLDAARLGAVLAARGSYQLPYFWSSMSLSQRTGEHGPLVRYRTRRRWPGPRGARSDVTVEVGARYADHELTDFDHFLTARWTLFSRVFGKESFARAEHPPWELHRARALHVDDELVAAAGLPTPTDEPLVHWSPGVDVRIGRPHRG